MLEEICDNLYKKKVVVFEWPRFQALLAKVGESPVHFITCVTSRVDTRQTQLNCVWASMESCPHSSELVIEASTHQLRQHKNCWLQQP